MGSKNQIDLMRRGGGYLDRRTLPLDPLLVHILYYICNIF